MALRIALFGQAAFGKDVLVRLLERGYSLVGVYAPPEGARPDPLAEEAKARGLPLFRHRRFRRKGTAIPELVDEHRALGVDLDLLAYVTVILPPEIVEAPPHGSLCFHPSLLPRYRGGAAIPWQIIRGETTTGVTVFRPDEGVDTGPIVVQRGGVPIGDTDTAASLYYDRLYPLGIEAMVEAVDAVAAGTARYQPQDESLASFQGLLDDEAARVDWSRDVASIDRLIRGCDPQPGAWALRGEEVVRLFGARRVAGEAGAEPGTVVGQEPGSLLLAAHGGLVSIGKLRLGSGPKLPAAEAGLAWGERLS